MAFAELAAPPGAQPSSLALRRQAAVVVTLLIVALLTRGLWIGDPLIGGDEQFYLLVGDRIWQGALPYVDIWDRKPIGLFLIYAALRPFSENGIVAYQIGALIFATLTALTITRIATRLVPLAPATLAGVVYLLMLPVLGGVGGQAPVFYNLFMALAALMVIKAGESADDRRAVRFAVAAMALAGLAIQVKYIAVLEGMAFGVWLLALRWQRRRAIGDLFGHAAILIFVALVPTLLAAAFYAAKGYASVFLFTNLYSIFLKRTPSSEVINIATNAVTVGPWLIFALAGFGLSLKRQTMSRVKLFLALWTIAAIAGFFAIGHYYTHYALPMLVPLSVASAMLLEDVAGLAIVLTVALSFDIGIVNVPHNDRMVADRAKADRMVQILTPYTRYGCIYINEGPTAIYLLTHSCLPTRYVFPEHLTLAAEAAALDTQRAMAELFDRRPPAIVVRHWTEADLRNVATDTMLARTLAAGYHRKATIPAPKPRDVLEIYTRNDLP